jgi:archaellum biogenesis ATPase FlaH
LSVKDCLIISTAVISGLHKTVQAPEVGVAYFYFDYRKQRSQRADDTIRTMLKQLLRQSKELPSEVEKAYTTWDKKGRKESLTSKKILQLISVVSKTFSKGVFIIIDAFNECLEGEEQEKLIQHLRQLHEYGIRLLVTTRPHLKDDLEKVLPTASFLEVSADESDVETYLRSKLRHYKFRPKLKDDIVQAIKPAAAGMYSTL